LPNGTLFEQHHRTGPSLHQEADNASLGLRSAEDACRTIEGYKAMHAIRKGQIRWVAKGDP
jgi:hypothetical protein